MQVNNGLTDLHVGTLISNGNYLFAGTEFCSSCGGIFISTNNGDNWVIVPQFNLQQFSSMDKNSNYVYAVGGDLVFTSNNGLNWFSYTYMPNGSHYYEKVAAKDNNIFVGLQYFSNDPGGIYKSTDYGFNWVQTSFPTAQYSNVWSIAINNNYIFASSTMLNTYRSSDNGITWNQCLNTGSVPITVKGDSVYVFGGPYPGYFYYSSNNGTNWTQIQDSLVAYALLVYGNYLFAAGSQGFYESSNNGINWFQRNEGGGGDLLSLCISNGYIFAGTDGGGVIRRPLGEIVGINLISNKVPETIELKQNYPNPFNPNTKIKFEIPNFNPPLAKGGSKTSLNIYDILGNEVAMLVNEKLVPGTYEVEWDASNYASGIYFYKLVAGDFSETKKMVLLK